MNKNRPGEVQKGTCANCRHWRPHAGSPTNMVCGVINSHADKGGGPVIVTDRADGAKAAEPMVLATPGNFGCTWHSV